MATELLLPGEELDFGEGALLKATTLSDKELNERYSAGAVRIVTEQARYPLPQIPQMVASDDYKLDPEFQRRHRWDDEKKSRLIESFIMNVPIPPVFLYEVGYAKYEVMDGLQRLTAISDFYSDRLVLRGLEEWPELNGRTYKSLPDAVRRGVDRRYLSSVVLLQETASSQIEAQRLKQLVFERINSGGVSLSNQESRNAIFDGPMNRLCLRLSRRDSLCRTWGIPGPTEEEAAGGDINPAARQSDLFSQMMDVELVLRFFAYRQRLEHQEGALKDFLDSYLQKANLLDKRVLSQLEVVFAETIDLAYELFEEEAFYLWRKRVSGWGWYKRATTSVYDPMMYALSGFRSARRSLLNRRYDLREATKKMYEAEYSQFEGRYTNRENLKRRNELFVSLFQSLSR
jgi:hypothetical protein